MATSLDEWIAGTKADGTELPRRTCNQYRKRHGLPPLTHYVNTTVQRPKPATGSPKPESCCKKPAGGTGTELKTFLAELDAGTGWCESCTNRAALMDSKGIQWCRDNIDTIAGWLVESERKNAEALARAEKKLAEDETPPADLVEKHLRHQRIVSAWAAMRSLTWINPLRPHHSIVDEAIRRAEAKQASECSCQP